MVLLTVCLPSRGKVGEFTLSLEQSGTFSKIGESFPFDESKLKKKYPNRKKYKSLGRLISGKNVDGESGKSRGIPCQEFDRHPVVGT